MDGKLIEILASLIFLIFLDLFYFSAKINNMKRFLKITKTKLVLILVFVILSLVISLVISLVSGAFYTIALNHYAAEEELIYFVEYILPIPFLLLTILKLYLFSCVAVYLIERSKNR